MGETARTTANTTWEAMHAVLRVTLTLLEAGRSSHDAAAWGRHVGRGWGLDTLEVFALGRVVNVQVTEADGRCLSVSGSVASLDAFDCDRLKRLGALLRSGAGSAPPSPRELTERIEEIGASRRPLW